MNALVPIREEDLKAAIGDVQKIPSFKDSMEVLRTQVLSEHLEDIKTEFKYFAMDLDGFIQYNDAAYQYTKHALSQAVYRIKPEGVVGMAGYLIACPPDLRSVNFNFWHQDKFAVTDANTKGNKILMRVRTDEYSNLVLRAVVSQVYDPNDDVPVLEALGSIVEGGAHLACARGDIKSRYSLIWPTDRTEVYPGEEVMVALRLINSETGASSVRIDPMIYHVGSHGYYLWTRGGSDVSIRHIGEAKKRLSKAYQYMKNEIQPFIERLKESYNDSFSNRFETSNQMFDCLGQALSIPDAKIAAIKNQWQNNGAVPNRAGIGNAMIQVAQNLDIEAGEELQHAAGRLIQSGWAFVEYHKDKL